MSKRSQRFMEARLKACWKLKTIGFYLLRKPLLVFKRFQFHYLGYGKNQIKKRKTEKPTWVVKSKGRAVERVKLN